MTDEKGPARLGNGWLASDRLENPAELAFQPEQPMEATPGQPC